ncbi:possible nickel-dependent hydrogenase b561-type cytochrome subunit [Psychrobacter arcticus 273-4]|uniref:Possible nickel-dependent hydrogenase b561-type cytochrome subunit n=1 Tax=Psychrobacter arcticus (strain DSM 17307 / VKM B-2377 / 273-4) TaxID=259536 RepID=Q4FQP9_PSYA2|nr:cytochrome b [Psychrobacter arcticus]AAZ19659.1 possible nickel-dependent hydrogenase b561-type cytochrome subunit [Psychrobacter arcticus 273-4]
MNNTHSNLTKWSFASRFFHWISAILLLITWTMIFLYDNLDSNLYIGLHKAFGVSLLFWMIARVINRIFTKAPPAVVMPKWQMLLSQLSHFALYALLIAMPIAGLLMSLYGGRPVDMFGVFQIPVFVTPDRGLARLFNDWHTGIIWSMIIAFTVLHIAAALYHQFVKKDNLIARIK